MAFPTVRGGTARSMGVVQSAGARQATAVTIGADVVDFRGYFKVENYAPSEVIFRPGDESNKVYLLKRGRVRIMRLSGADVRSVTAMLTAGDIFGSIAHHAPMSDELAIAGEACEIWSMNGADFKQLMLSRPSLALDVVRAQRERINAMKAQLVGLTFKEVPARLAQTILALGEKLGERCPHGGEIDLRGVTQQDLADMVGASRSFVSTLINEMKRDGCLGNVGRTLCIRDLKALRKLAAQEK